MPVPLGDFISKEVYEGKLQSEHSITDFSCISFVDVSNGEEERGGHSWKVCTAWQCHERTPQQLIPPPPSQNVAEVHTIMNLVRLYYLSENFCIITPYDAQRSAIEKQLKSEGLPCEQVFTVDSFQGWFDLLFPYVMQSIAPDSTARSWSRLRPDFSNTNQGTWFPEVSKSYECDVVSMPVRRRNRHKQRFYQAFFTEYITSQTISTYREMEGGVSLDLLERRWRTQSQSSWCPRMHRSPLKKRRIWRLMSSSTIVFPAFCIPSSFTAFSEWTLE
jgi:hypothetical protein